MADILEKIIAQKKLEVSQGKKLFSANDLLKTCQQNTPTRGFYKALYNRVNSDHPAVIAEIKKASPSKGVIRANFHPDDIAKSYFSAQATALSILTDQHFFQGNDTHLQAVRQAVPLPVIRKDFMVDEWQIIQSRAIGADCVLLIVAALDDVLLKNLYDCASSLGMDILIEVHDNSELERAKQLKPKLLGINNRNLKTFEVDLQTSIALKSNVPENTILVTESGVSTAKDIAMLREHGINAFLIGEAFMLEPNPGKALNHLFGF